MSIDTELARIGIRIDEQSLGHRSWEDISRDLNIPIYYIVRDSYQLNIEEFEKRIDAIF